MQYYPPMKNVSINLVASVCLIWNSALGTTNFTWRTGYSGDWHDTAIWTTYVAPNGNGNGITLDGTGLTTPNQINYKPLHSDPAQWNPLYASLFASSPSYLVTLVQQADPWGSNNLGAGLTVLRAESIVIGANVLYDLQGGTLSTPGLIDVAGELRLSGADAALADFGAGAPTLAVAGGGLYSQQDGSTAIQTVRVGSGGTPGMAILELDGGTLAADALYVGAEEGDGHVDHSGGTATVSGSLYVGGLIGIAANLGEGTYTLRGTGVLNSDGGVEVGPVDDGLFDQQAGTHNLTGVLKLGTRLSGVAGTYLMGGGVLEGGDLEVGGAGTGAFSQSSGSTAFGTASVRHGSLSVGGGTFDTAGHMELGPLTNLVAYNQNGGTASVGGDLTLSSAAADLSGGNLSVAGRTVIDTAATAGSGGFHNVGANHVVTGDIDVRSGLYTVSGAAANTVTLSNLCVGATNSLPLFHQQGGAVAAGNSVRVATGSAESGTYQFSGGSLASPALLVGNFYGVDAGFGTLILDGDGTLNVDLVRIGPYGSAGFLVNGAEVVIHGDLEVASEFSATGVLQAGGALEVASLKVGAGSAWQGTMTQDGGSMSVLGPLQVGYDGSPSSPELQRSYTLHSDGVLTTDTTKIMYGGRFHQDGTSQHNCQSLTVLGGTYEQDGGTLFSYGTSITAGLFDQQAGSNTVAGSLTLGAATGDPATYVLDGAASQLYVLGLGIGASGGGLLIQSNGTVTVIGTTHIGGTNWVDPGGLYVMQGGSFDGSDLEIGLVAEGSLVQGGGILSADAATVGWGSSLILSNGMFAASDLGFWNGGSGTFAGGTSTVATLTGYSGCTLQQSGGRIAVSGGVTLNQDRFGAMGFHGGTLQVGGTLDYRGLGNQGGGNGVLLVDGTASWVGAGDFLVGSSGVVSQSGSSSIHVDGTHVLAAAEPENVLHVVGSGCSLSSGSAIVGGLGRGNLQVSGHHSVTGRLEVGAAGSAFLNRYTLSGSGTLQAGELCVASQTGSSGAFYSSGAATVSGSMAVANATNATGTLYLYSGSINAGSFTLGGLTGHGTAFHNNGVLTCAGDAAVHVGSLYSLTSGTLAAGRLEIGGSFIVENGGLVAPRLRASVNNAGTLSVEGNVSTDVAGLTHRNTGTLSLLNNADWSFSSSNTLTNEMFRALTGKGTLGGSFFKLVNHGSLRPGDPSAVSSGYGTLTVRGALTQSPNAELVLEIGGTATSLKDKLVIASGGSAVLDGALRVDFRNFTPTVGSSFQLISGPNLTVLFPMIQVTGLPGNLRYTLTATATTYTLTVVDPPTAPSDVTATAASASAIRVDWTDTNGGAASHQVYESDSSSGPWSVSATVGPGTNTCLIAGLASGTTRWFALRAVVSSNLSDLSLPAAATTWTALEAWRFEHFGSIGNSGDGADAFDPLGDGIPNLEKYALGMDPLLDTSGHPNLPRPVFVEVEGSPSRHFGVEFRTPDPAPEDVTIGVLVSDDLALWQATPVPHGTNQPLPGIIRHVWRTVEPASDYNTRFLRLQFSTSPP